MDEQGKPRAGLGYSLLSSHRSELMGVAMLWSGLGRRFARRVFCAALALSLLLNTISFAGDGVAPRRALSEESVVELLHNGTRPEEIHRAEEALNAARAKSEFAEGVMVRRQQIYDEVEGVSVQELDNAISQAAAAAAETAAAEQAYAEAVAGPRVEEIAQAEAKLDSLRQELARQEYLLKETELIAPSDGVIRSRLLEVGDMASPQMAVFKLSLNDKKWVRAYVRETDLGKVHEGQKATVTIDSFPKDPIEGQVGYISGTAEFTPKTVQTDELRTSLLYEIRVYVSDPDNRLRLGMPATVRVEL